MYTLVGWFISCLFGLLFVTVLFGCFGLLSVALLFDLYLG